MNYVIIGNSAAAIGAVEGIRQVDRDGQIAIITDEPHHTYARPLISYLLLGKTTEEKMKYREDSFYADNKVELIADVSVTQIDALQKHVELSDGRVIPYDKLLVAAGSSAFVPAFDGIDTVRHRHTFMSLSDARGLDEDITEHARVLIVGAGLIGLKCAEGISARVKKVTVIDLAPRILSSILDDEGAAMVQAHLEAQGIEFVLSDGVEQFEQETAVLRSGNTIHFDVLVLAVGVRPNTALLRGIADIDRGIVVNEKSETGAKDIYAAGDCSQTIDVSDGQSKIMALLPNAYMQGECAGINMAGGAQCFDKAIPMNAIGFFGLHIITAGNYRGESYLERTNLTYKRLYHGDNHVNGYILIGNVERAGIYTDLIRERTPIDTIDFALICQNPGLMAFTREDRKRKLGGELI